MMASTLPSGESLCPQIVRSQIGGHTAQIHVLPRLGAALTSFKVDDRELLYFSEQALKQKGDYSGCFMMFPTPCRLTNSEYTFEGKRIRQTKHGRPVPIHGLIRDEVFQAAAGDNTLTCTIAITPDHPVYEGYPFECEFSLKFVLLERGLEIRFQYTNTGRDNAPFGYGLHPFWKILGARRDTWIRVPFEKYLELVDLIPTGKAVPVEGTDLDFRSPTRLPDREVDSVFWGRDLAGEHALEQRGVGMRIGLEASERFSHAIVYAPADGPFVCMENLTCSPDVPNVYGRGQKDVSGLEVVPPGKTIDGWVRYRVTGL